MGNYDFGSSGPYWNGISMLGSHGIGNVYYVANTTSTDAFADMWRRYGGKKYKDGSKILHPHTSTSGSVTVDGLTAALACTVEDRNDYVIVMGANNTYYIDAALALNKKNVHIICPAGLGYDIGATNAARIQQLTALTAVFAVSDASVEIAGFYLKNVDKTSHITLAATSYAVNIHHNTLPLIWVAGAQVGAIVGTGDAGAWGKIERNWIVSQAGNALTCAAGIILIQSSATATQVNHNQITIGDKNVATIGIANYAVKGHTDFNIFSESGGGAVADGGTISSCIAIHASGCAIGNRGAVATAQLLSGGTTAHSFCDNIGGHTGDCGHATQLEA